MKVIMVQDVGGVGKRHEVKDVADGYALNFLIPRGLAEQATSEKLIAHEKRMMEEAAAKKVEKEELARLIQSLEGARIEIKARTTEKGGLFKSIGTKEIVAACVAQRGVHIPEEVVRIKQAIKSTGEHAVEIAAPDAKVGVTVVVTSA